jgi:hypothetical protein
MGGEEEKRSNLRLPPYQLIEGGIRKKYPRQKEACLEEQKMETEGFEPPTFCKRR